MKRHTTFPDRQNFPRMLQIVGEVVEEGVAHAASEEYPKGGIDDEVIELFFGQRDVP